jgi:radical SAM superfamily enzyme YgiQ (UPF0313 family)
MRFAFVHASRNWHGRVYPEYPLGPGLLATIMRRAGHDSCVFDAAVDDRPVEILLDSWGPDAIGISFLSTSVATALDLLRSLRAKTEVPLIAGGIHATLMPEQVLRAGADVVVRGEGEPALPALVYALTAAGGARHSLHRFLPSVPNAAWLEGDMLRQYVFSG